MGHISRRCKECQNPFEADMREVNRGNAIFCSRSCSKKHQNKNIVREVPKPNCFCDNCGTEYYRVKSRLNTKSGLTFCSKECKNQHQKDTVSYSKDYRRTVRLEKGMSKCEECGYSKHPEILQVHHIDRDRDNNLISNLKVLCPNCHETVHFTTGTGRYKKGESCSLAGELALQAG